MKKDLEQLMAQLFETLAALHETLFLCSQEPATEPYPEPG
jgi:hypothetical protein